MTADVISLADYRASRAPKRDCMAEALEIQEAFIKSLGLRTETAMERLSQIPCDSE